MAKMKIPVAKAKGEYVEIDTDSIPEEMYREALLQGLKQMLGRGFSKISKATYPVEADLKKAAVEKAQANAKAVLENDQKTIKLTGTTAKAKVSGEVAAEARRLARNLVKDELRKKGVKISSYPSAEITKGANAFLAHEVIGPRLIAQAEANIAERSKIETGNVDILSIIQASPQLIAKAEAKKAAAKKDKPLSAKQAGKAMPHKAKAKPSASEVTVQ